MVERIYEDFSNKNLKTRRVDRAITVGAELFLEKGIDNVKMTDIAEASGIGVATLYRYFRTKTGIAVEVMTFLWKKIRELFAGVFDSPNFMEQTGLKQLQDLMKMFLVLFHAHKDFMKLLGDFDRFVLREDVPKDELENYDQSIVDFYPVLERAYIKGVEDGSVRKDLDFKHFYLAYAHSLMELCKKFIGGEILPSDDFSDGVKELEILIESAVYYLAADKDSI